MAKKPQTQQPESTAIAPAAEGQLMVFDQAEVPDYIKNEQRGSENVGQEDIVIPRLEMIQALSPQVKEGDAKFNGEARAGMLVNSVTQRLYGKDAIVVPVMYIKQWLVWGKRKWVDAKGREQKSEGGFFGAFNSPMEAESRMQQEINDKGLDPLSLEVLDTPQHLCLLLDYTNGKTEEIMISMPRTKAKVSRQWNTLVRMAGGDRFSRAYRVGTAMEKNKQGDDYYNFTVAQLGFPNKAVYLKAEELYKLMESGRKVTMDVTDYETDTAPAQQGGTEDPEM